MAFFDYPNLSSVDQARWEEWLHGTYECPKAVVSMHPQLPSLWHTLWLASSRTPLPQPMNTLFLHLFVAKEGFQQGASAEILQ